MFYELVMKNDKFYFVREKRELYVLNDILADINKQLEPYGFYVDRDRCNLPLEISVHSVIIKNNKYNFLVCKIKQDKEYNLILLDESSDIIKAFNFNITYDCCECYFSVKEVDICNCNIKLDNQINEIKSNIENLSKRLNLLENLYNSLSKK